MKKLGFLAASAALASLAGAQSFNVDYEAFSGPSNGAPPPTFGAAGSVGWWNTVSGPGVSAPLFDLGNNATTVTLNTSNGSTFASTAQGYSGKRCVAHGRRFGYGQHRWNSHFQRAR